ncbi:MULTISPECIES: class III lanthionine synthetase LanKC [Microbacterium]|uniref:non-specific serine/threonine protein kinase n=1 Tax=Microbacterium wangchenii TaxID=2541726 RepID=A0ABX5SSM2_9MICO|nr:MULTISPECIES: class III lanthionine synthetase LanKC [Microbacterium]MCK6068508.1 class III lanthionine synthetase LanKC [Microbacterium sp. EYE_512]QBR89144.1 serine/threonine protein kinase [Microbacterium wangchenii]TXK09224.1 protein kinase/lanthionine synthetase C family protein [Microbacterium wangchenii]
MDPIHPRFTLADSEFYDDPRRLRVGAAPRFVVPSHLDWDRWQSSGDGHWSYWLPPAHVLPEQGWKIHLSSTANSAARVLDVAAVYCHENRLAFKHLQDHQVLEAVNAKDADRTASGKFVTIYPTSPEQLQCALRDLGKMTARYDGPHILSDLHWHQGPVFVRYGGFLPLFTEVDGERLPAIRHPDGSLVPDLRGTAFGLPSWVTVPDLLSPLLEASRDTTVPPGFPTVTKALHFSNAGGVYEAVDGGRTVVVKEARPFAGLTPDGRDAITRITQEARVLQSLDNPSVVRAVRSFEVHGHRYLVTERVPGRPLSTEVVSRHPLARADSDEASERSYRDWALNVCRRLDAVVADLHEAGYTHGDLHPGNFLMRGECDVVLIDFEMARPAADNAAALIGAPGFTPNQPRRGTSLDRYALGCIKLFLFVPLTPLINADRSKAPELVRWAQRRFDLPDEWANDVLKDIAPGTSELIDVSASQDIDARIKRLQTQLLADATPDRKDRLWPGDPIQFDQPSFALAHGALGPLMALHDAGARTPEDLVDWAVQSTRTARAAGPGLMDGLAGAAVAFGHLGRQDASDEALARTLGTDLGDPPHLYGGLAGIGLAYLQLSDTRPQLLEEALKIAVRLRRHTASWSSDTKTSVPTGTAGLMRGASGIALFFLHLFDKTGDRTFIHLAEDGVRADIRLCAFTADGSLQVNEGWRMFPYLGAGSAGIGHVLVQLLDRHPTSPLRGHLAALTRATHSELVYEAGLIQGRAGFIHYLSGLDQRGLASDADRRALRRHLERLDLHAIAGPAGTGFAGRGLLRRSGDLATGAAGVLHTLVAARSGWSRRAALPFLPLPSELSLPLSGAEPLRGGDTYGVSAFVAGTGAA